MPKSKTKTMSKAEIEEWDKLYQYIKKNILKYDSSQNLPRTLVLRLKGLAYGKYIENKNIADQAQYSYKIVLYTFIMCKPKIDYILRTKNFDNEKHKFDYICKIIENNLNEVYTKYKKAQQAQISIQNSDTNVLDHSSATYQKNTKSNINPKLKDLW